MGTIILFRGGTRILSPWESPLFVKNDISLTLMRKFLWYVYYIYCKGIRACICYNLEIISLNKVFHFLFVTSYANVQAEYNFEALYTWYISNSRLNCYFLDYIWKKKSWILCKCTHACPIFFLLWSANAPYSIQVFFRYNLENCNSIYNQINSHHGK